MITALNQLPPHFLARLLAGMAVNFEIAAAALLCGLALGVPIALARLVGGVAGAAAGALVALMRAVPTFVVMFFLLYALPHMFASIGLGAAPSATVIVALSLLPYAAAYVADNVLDAARNWRRGSRLAALQLLPNLARAFFVLVMSSSTGAAIGVTEAITVILRDAQRLPNLSDRLVVFAIGVLFFGVILQAGLAVVNMIRQTLGRIATQHPRKQGVLAAAVHAHRSFGG